MSHYDREVDIAALNLEGFDGCHAYGEQHEWVFSSVSARPTG